MIQQPPKVQVATLFEKTSANGNRYFYGYLGAARVVMLQDAHAESTDPQWQLFVQPGPEKPKANAAPKKAPAKRPINDAARQAPFNDPLPNFLGDA